MRRWHVAAVNLAVALRAIAKKCTLQRGIRSYISQQRRVIRPQRARPMSRVTSQAKERRRLPHQAVGHRAVRLVADRAVLSHRWMFVRERPLLVGMAPVADEIDRR